MMPSMLSLKSKTGLIAKSFKMPPAGGADRLASACRASPVRRTEVAARCPRAMQEDERQEILRRRARAAEMVLHARDAEPSDTTT